MGAWAGVIGFAVVLLLIGLRVQVAVAMGLIGIFGYTLLSGWASASYLIGNLAFEAIFPYGLSVVPLFVFMGVFSAHAGLSKNLYEAVYSLIGHFRGGLAMATIGACASFGAVCGSSLATCATMGRVALPEMSRRGYSPSLAAGVVAAGGTLGILIPPSIILVIYALITEQSIGALFSAALLPGLLGAAFYMTAIIFVTWRDPDAGPAGDKLRIRERLRAVSKVWDVASLFGLVIGGIYTGLFSPTEAAAVGAGGALILAAIKGHLTLEVLLSGIQETALTTGMIFLILIGAAYFNIFLEATELPQTAVNLISSAGLSTWLVLLLIILMYLILGCFMDSLSMILLTLPSVFPVIEALGINPIWFGILLVSVVEIGLITPPIGMNLFIIQAISPDHNLKVVFRGVLPFIMADIMRVGVLLLFPALVLWLPSLAGLL